MKKILGMAVIALFLVSMVPAALAQGGNDAAGSGAGEGEGNDTIDAAEADAAMSGTGVQAVSKGDLTSVRTQLQERRQDIKANLEQARERYVAARQNYATARAAHLETRERFLETREQFNECKGDQSEDCQQVREEIRLQTRDVLAGTADRVTAMMEKLSGRIEMSGLSDEDKAERIAAIDARIAEIGAARQSAEGISENSTPQEIRAAAQDLKQSWAKTRANLKVNSARMINERIGGIVVQMEQVSTKLDAVIARLESKGYDTSAAESLRPEFDAKVQSANDHYDAAQALFGQVSIEDAEASETKVSEAHTHIVAAKQDLKDARDILRSIVQEIRSTGNGDAALEEQEELAESGAE